MALTLMPTVTVCSSSYAVQAPGLLRVDYVSDVDSSDDWALVLPASSGTTWVVCLHGHGSHGDQLYTRCDLRERWLPEFLSRGVGVVTPNLRDNAWMGPAAVADLHRLLAWLRESFGAERFIFTSGSMGGTGNLIYGSLYPEDVGGIIARGAAADLASYHTWCRGAFAGPAVLAEIAAAIEVSYGGAPEESPETYRRHSAFANAERLCPLPIFLVHGSDDAIIPVSQSRRLVGALAEATHLAYVEVPGGNHDSPLHLQITPDPLDWVLERG